MSKENLFKWKHYQPEIILLTVRWYLRYNLSFRNLVEMMEERGLSMAHTTIMRWVHQYGPDLDKRIRRHLKQTNDSWSVDETYIKVKGQWMYLYRAVDSEGNTIDFYLSELRDKQAAKCFFKKALATCHSTTPRVITVDKNPVYPVAIQELKEEKSMPEGIRVRQIRYLNNIVEQDHRFIRKRVRLMKLINHYWGTATCPSSLGKSFPLKRKKRYSFCNMMERIVVFMCRKVSEELSLFSQELQQSLSPDVLNQLAKKVGIVQRKSKYQANDSGVCLEIFDIFTKR